MYEFYYSTWFLTSLNIVLVPLTNSYIHPDEHYQSLEPLLKFINNGLDENMNNGSITWEYSTLSNLPIRSITILRVYYELLLRNIASLDPYEIIISTKLTFPLWLILPCTYKAYHLLMKKPKKVLFGYAIGLSLSLAFAFTTITYMDSMVYYNCKKFVFTPLENWKYNSNSTNLAKHGIHSRVNHLLINFPTLISPFVLIILAFYSGSQVFIENKLPLLTCASGLFFLSLFPHQEARFLIPCVPLFYISLDFENIKAKYHSSSSRIKKISQLALLGHVVFNILMLFLMGSLHQSGLVNLTNNPTTLSLINNNDFVFWHTLMPLHWPFYLKIKDKSNLFIHFVDDEAGDNGFRELRLENNFKDTHNLYDFMGVDTNNFMHLINGIKQRKEQDMMSIILVTPSRFQEELNALNCEYDVIDHFSYHLNLNDGFDKSPFGLDVLKVLI
ncbi:unnamed protein product [Hanseniaspora opuntiae]